VEKVKQEVRRWGSSFIASCRFVDEKGKTITTLLDVQSRKRTAASTLYMLQVCAFALSYILGRNEGAKRAQVTIPRAPFHCWHRKVSTMSLQCSTFAPERPQVRTWGAKLASWPGRHLTSVNLCAHTSALKFAGCSVHNVSQFTWLVYDARATP